MKKFIVIFVVLVIGCSTREPLSNTIPQFTNVTAGSGISFRNDLIFTDKLNPYTYRNFYNGAGVGLGDINNDGLLDIYLTGNQVENKLYVNNGNFTFSDATESAGVACKGAWSTGVTFVDINSDGRLDIYVCKSGSPDTPYRYNELFINNGDLTFTEKSKEYGLDIVGLSIQAAFFDYDKDGDLDCYLLTNSIKSVGSYDLVKDKRNTPDPDDGGNKFFVNDNGMFRDHSKEANIYRSAIGFGLGITLGDFNEDSWTDIFVSNDFFERDYLYINDQRGSFHESLTDYFQSISMGSMGADLADLDGDGKPELFVTEMLPDSLNRRKTKTIYENWNKYKLNIENGYHHQFSRNVLQKKIGDKNYVEVGRMAGVSATEWSWGALLFDMDNDGKRDIFVANGIYKDLLDRDYLTFTGVSENVRKIIGQEKQAIIKLIDLMPSSKFPNYAFKNEGNLHFRNVAVEWGLGEPNFSSGSAYGDLDNDGDLDLIVSNINAPLGLYRNNSDSAKFKSITLSLSSGGLNTMEVGSQVIVYFKNGIAVADNFVTRGFQSSVQPDVLIGLGEGVKQIDSLLIRWADNGYSILRNVHVNSKISVKKENEKILNIDPWKVKIVSQSVPIELVSKYAFRHKSSGLVDFNRDRLIPMMYSNETPSLIKGDINSDGVEEVYVGGGKDQPGTFIEFKGGKIQTFLPKSIEHYQISEETKGALADVDGDGDLDFYMAVGGRFFDRTSSALMDRLFLNDGNGNFEESPNPLPFKEFISTSVVKPIDFDKDGDSDLVIGERFDPSTYGRGGRAYLFENDGTGVFKDVTIKCANALIDIGMVTDIEVVDLDGNGSDDLVIVGDWMPIVALINEKGTFVDYSRELGLKNTEGWWHEIASGDLNKDGKIDFVLGNHGLNTFFKEGDRMFINDFDKNGSIEQIFCTKNGDEYFPVVDKDEFLSQLPSFKKKLLYYKDYGKKSLEELFGKEILKESKVFEVKKLSSILLLSDSVGYQHIDLPQEAQFSPIYSLLIIDFDDDGIDDLLAGGNNYGVKPQFGRHDASSGWFFKGVLKGNTFSFKNGVDLNVRGEIRGIEYVELKGVKYILFGKYDDDLEIYKISN
ncbi:VCBS repeat-containing protein [soil metagenome]